MRWHSKSILSSIQSLGESSIIIIEHVMASQNMLSKAGFLLNLNTSLQCNDTKLSFQSQRLKCCEHFSVCKTTRRKWRKGYDNCCENLRLTNHLYSVIIKQLLFVFCNHEISYIIFLYGFICILIKVKYVNSSKIENHVKLFCDAGLIFM